MGCTGCRGSQAEEILRGVEHTLLPDYSAFLTFKAFQPFLQESQTISSEDLDSLLSKISPSLLPDNNRATSILFSGEYQTQPYPLKDVMCLYLLIAIGDNKLKAELLFKTYSGEDHNSISAETFNRMMRDIFDISCKSIPRVAIKFYGGQNSSLENYFRDLNHSKAIEIVSGIITDVMGQSKRINQQKFVQVISEDYPFILHSKKVREHCLNPDSE